MQRNVFLNPNISNLKLKASIWCFQSFYMAEVSLKSLMHSALTYFLFLQLILAYGSNCYSYCWQFWFYNNVPNNFLERKTSVLPYFLHLRELTWKLKFANQICKSCFHTLDFKLKKVWKQLKRTDFIVYHFCLNSFCCSSLWFAF